jgi:ribosomal protein L35
MDYGKFKYEAAQRAKESRRKSTSVSIKEMKYRVKIGKGDFETKTAKVEKFLSEGHKVKLTIMFRGREVFHPELGMRILERVAEHNAHLAKVEAAPRHDGPRPRQAGAGRVGPPPGRGGRRGRRRQRRHRPAARLAAAARTRHDRPGVARMPKMKTHRGAAKRIKVTGTGKLRRRQAFLNHILEKKSSTRTRRLGRETDVAPGDRRKVRRLLGT